MIWLATAFQWCRRHALALVAGIAAVLGLLAYALGRRRPGPDERERRAASDAGRAEGAAEVHGARADEHARAAREAAENERVLAEEQARLRAAAERRRGEIMGEDAAAVSEGLNALEARRRARQAERGRP